MRVPASWVLPEDVLQYRYIEKPFACTAKIHGIGNFIREVMFSICVVYKV